jgi:hypothetical protein
MPTESIKDIASFWFVMNHLMVGVEERNRLGLSTIYY